jgi:hypothetical protein
MAVTATLLQRSIRTTCKQHHSRPHPRDMALAALTMSPMNIRPSFHKASLERPSIRQQLQRFIRLQAWATATTVLPPYLPSFLHHRIIDLPPQVLLGTEMGMPAMFLRIPLPIPLRLRPRWQRVSSRCFGGSRGTRSLLKVVSVSALTVGLSKPGDGHSGETRLTTHKVRSRRASASVRAKQPRLLGKLLAFR